jgi:hypothetical protein
LLPLTELNVLSVESNADLAEAVKSLGLIQSLEISSLDPELTLALEDFRGLHNVRSST